MGKRRKRLRMLKYAKKYAAIRSTVAKVEERLEGAPTPPVLLEEEVAPQAAEIELSLPEVDPPAPPEPSKDLRPQAKAKTKKTTLKKAQPSRTAAKKKAPKTKKPTATREKK
tara:strand:- start:4533 stop:4868 length:336 start_codon:yes stop_codon:yes gene_type:complete